ncbi:hypothetical protein MSAN_01684900 [Mycena sanguinolenta]|uniref:Uncharacterized protein n=1 Tax=Mycena sanguinolenta TaxID=230812 RepID=A0A8H6Y0K9_9AGAR|nr:hypothetical protein MSAN_01684900 [Mycena sanguinolenta]
MDQPSWSDALRASLGASLPCVCLASAPRSDRSDSSASDDEHVNNARLDKLVGLLAVLHSPAPHSNFHSNPAADDAWRDDDVDPDAFRSRWIRTLHLGPSGGARSRPSTRPLALPLFDTPFGMASPGLSSCYRRHGAGVRASGKDGSLLAPRAS